MENNLASVSATGIRRGIFLEFVLFVSRWDTLSEFEIYPNNDSSGVDLLQWSSKQSSTVDLNNGHGC